MEIISTTDEIKNSKSRDFLKLKCLYCYNIFLMKKKYVLDNQKLGGLNGSFCSSKCAGMYKYNKINLTCKNCNKSIIRYPREIKTNNFCSRKCSALFYMSIKFPIKNRKIIKPRNKAIIITLTCDQCNATFQRYASQLSKKSTKRFCNRSCQAKYANKTWNRKTRFGINKSRAEKILFNIIKEHYPNINILENNRTILPDGLELDLYLSDHKIAIELNGPCHYIPIFGENELNKTKSKDIKKIDYCQKLGIKLFIINIMGVKNQQKLLLDVFINQIKPILDSL